MLSPTPQPDLEKQEPDNRFGESEHSWPLSGSSTLSTMSSRGEHHPKTSQTKEKENASDGQQLKMIRTFSNRTNSEPANHHIFGGDTLRQKVESDLQRFASQTEKEQIVVNWEGENDPEDPHNWSLLYRWYITGLAGLLVLNSTFVSTIPGGIISQLDSQFGFGQEVGTLTISIFVCGYILGPLIWGPISERIGRYPVFLVSMLFYTVFNVLCAVSQNTASILVFRFLSGTFSSAPLTNSGGLISDIWDVKRRGVAMSIYAISPFAGPCLGPIVGGAIQVTGTSWRWAFWTCAIFSGVSGLITAITLKETYNPIILTRKAKRIRKETGDNRYVSPLELSPLDPKHLLSQTLGKPFVMLAQEIILLSLTIYMSFIYGVLYLLFEAYPFVFEKIHGFNQLSEGLMFIPFFLGAVVAVIIHATVINTQYGKKVDTSLKEGRGGKVPPEERLIPVMIAAPLLVLAFFWFGWTSFRSISFWSPMMAGSLLGFGIIYVFLGCFNYIIDCYLSNAASALSANTILRSLAGAGFGLFANQMYDRLGAHWASSLLGFLALLMAPIPFIFYRFGPKIRSLSKHSPA